VVEISDYIRSHVLHLREGIAESKLVQTAEQMYEQLGGDTYCRLREEAEIARGQYFVAHCALAKKGLAGDEGQMEESRLFHARWQHGEAELAALRRSWGPTITKALRETAEAYWRQVDRCRISDNFFVAAKPNSAPARLPHICPPWWGLFVVSLQRVVARTNPATCRLLQELPRLRWEATRPRQKKVLTALVEEWREANAERHGLLKPVHFPMLERRAFEKWDKREEWFNRRVDGLAEDSMRRGALVQVLGQHLAEHTRQRPDTYWNN